MRVKLEKKAEKYYLSQTATTRKRFKDALTDLSKEPMQGDILPLSGKSGLFRLRVGDWRMLFEVCENLIKVTKIEPRGQIYKKL